MNQEINEYFNILCNNDYPGFIDKYLNTKELNRLKGIGQFCGCDYTKLYNIKYWYSRYYHSIAVALMTWNFTKDKDQTLAALFHDLGTPVFSHSIDFMLGDSLNQESSELNVKDIIMNSDEIKKLLIEDNIDINLVCNIDKYTIIENSKPKLCADRLDGVLHTVLIWLNTYDIKKIETIYKNIVVLNNEDNELELGFKNKESGEEFFEAVMIYSIELQKNEDKYILSYIANATKYLIDNNIINHNDLYKLSEEEVIKMMKLNISSWNIFEQANTLIRTEIKPNNKFYVSTETKKRTVIPICLDNDNNIRLNLISNKVEKQIQEYKDFKDSTYCYVEDILPF